MVPRTLTFICCVVLLASCSPEDQGILGPLATADPVDQVAAETNNWSECHFDPADFTGEVPPPPPDQWASGRPPDPKGLVREAVLLAATAMESYFADHNVYPSVADALPWYRGRPDPSVTLGIESFGANGYALVARHPAWPGSSCILVAGETAGARLYRTDHEGLRATVDDMEPTCDRMHGEVGAT